MFFQVVGMWRCKRWMYPNVCSIPVLGDSAGTGDSDGTRLRTSGERLCLQAQVRRQHTREPCVLTTCATRLTATHVICDLWYSTRTERLSHSILWQHISLLPTFNSSRKQQTFVWIVEKQFKVEFKNSWYSFD